MDTPFGSASNEENGDAYPDLKGCLMVFGGPAAYESKHRQKLKAKEVKVAALGEAVLVFLKWLETMITFNRKDHPDYIPQLGPSSLSSTQSLARPTYPISSWMAEAASTSSTP